MLGVISGEEKGGIRVIYRFLAKECSMDGVWEKGIILFDGDEKNADLNVGHEV